MRRRIASENERCEQALGRQAIWKARRLGRAVEERCSRKRVAGSPFCLWHQPGRVEAKRKLSNDGAVAVYAEVVALRLQYGPPPIGKAWWGQAGRDLVDFRLAIPSLAAFARSHGLSESALSDLLRGKQYHRIGSLRVRRGRWTLTEVVAALLWLRREYGGIPTPNEYQRHVAHHPGLPSVKTLRRFFGTWSRIPLISGIPSTARRREWTPEEEEYVLENAGLLPATDIAHRLNRTPSAVQEKTRALGCTIYDAQGYVTLSEAVRSYGAPFHQLRNAAMSHRIPCIQGIKGGGRRILFFEPGDVEAWLERRSGGLLLAGGSE